MKANAWLATAALLAAPSLAHAANGKVVVAGAGTDRLASGVQKELGAMGFEPVRVDASGLDVACSEDAIASWIEAAHADGATCSDGQRVHVWVVSSAGLRRADIVAPREDEPRGSETVAVRAAEIARASLQIALDDRAPSAVAPPPPPVVPPSAAPSIKTLTFGPHEPREQPWSAARKPERPRYAPSFSLGAGISALVGSDFSVSAVGINAEVGVSRHIAIGARAEIPPSPVVRWGTTESATIAPSLLAFSVMVPLTTTDTWIVPRVGGGLGAVWVHTGPGYSGFSGTTVNQTVVTRREQNVFSGATYMDVALALRIVGPLRLTLDGVLGTAMQRTVVRAQGQDVAYWGVPFGVVALRLEVAVK